MYRQYNRKSHKHRFFIDANTGDEYCLCGKKKGEKQNSKYHNVNQTYNGITYHSKFEANYAGELDFRKKGKDIKDWERQVKLELKVNGVKIFNYYIDFIIHHLDGSREFVEVKGMELPLWRAKWKILEATFEDFKQHPDDRLTIIKNR